MPDDSITDQSETERDGNSPLKLAWSAVTDVGRFRKNNEDAFLALQMDPREVQYLGKVGEASLSDGDYIFAVSDGMGGHNAGEFASRIAVDKITELLPAAFRLDVQGLRCGAGDLLEQLFESIHHEIQRLGQSYEELEGMGATLSMCWVRQDWMHFCHIGDSRIYYLPRDGGIKQVSEDHTYVGWLVKTGRIKPAEARYHPAKNQINQALTAGSKKIEPQLGAVGYEPGDRFVICSDGLTDGLSDNGINHLIRQCPKRFADLSPAEAIVKESLIGSGRDNTTAVVVEMI